MKRRTIAILAAAAVFLLLFGARFAFELMRAGDDAGSFQTGPVFDAEPMLSKSAPEAKRNYASAKIVVDQAAAPQTVEQKYERVSNIESRTDSWDADAELLRKAIGETGALVQRENAAGLPGARYLSLSLGVVPQSFDEAVEKFKKIGRPVSVNTVKTDRTADFRALEAKRRSLEKTRDGLAALRSAGAPLADRVSLESRILEIEGQIQELGVNLGDFSELNSFCTVNVELREVAERNSGALIAGAFFDALAWTVPLYFGLVFALLCVLGAVSLGFRLYDRFKGHRG